MSDRLTDLNINIWVHREVTLLEMVLIVGDKLSKVLSIFLLIAKKKEKRFLMEATLFFLFSKIFNMSTKNR